MKYPEATRRKRYLAHIEGRCWERIGCAACVSACTLEPQAFTPKDKYARMDTDGGVRPETLRIKP